MTQLDGYGETLRRAGASVFYQYVNPDGFLLLPAIIKFTTFAEITI